MNTEKQSRIDYLVSEIEFCYACLAKKPSPLINHDYWREQLVSYQNELEELNSEFLSQYSKDV